jgi:hypothetical protein
MELETEIQPDDTEAMPDIRSPEDLVSSPLVNFVLDKMSRSETARKVDEQRWLRAYRNYRGIYGPDVQFTEAEKSRIFVKVTKSKVIAAYGQVADVLFGSDRFPLGIEPTTLPEGVAESVHFDVQDTPPEAEPQGKPELRPGETMQSLKERLGPLKEKLAPVEGKLKEGPGTTQTQITLHPALVAAKNMEKKIHDQLEESHATKHLRKTGFEMVLFGTGIMKGPFAVNKEYPKWMEGGDYKPTVKTTPAVSSVSCWNFYPDPDADCMEEAEYVVERHKMARSALRKLKKRPHFRSKAINHAVEVGENYVPKWWEHLMEDNAISPSTNRFEVLEFWGYVDTELLEDMDVPLGDLKDQEQVSVNIWVCNGQVLRCVLNPFTPSYIPYYAVPYEVNPYSFFGVGIAENMDDTQTMMNGFMRMAIDNAALSGNLIIEVDESNLVPGQDLRVFPGKVFRRQGGAPGQAIFGTKYPNVSTENMQMFDKARQLADESTGLPSFSHGQTGITGVGRTSSGISMLMSAASGSIRTVVKNIDDYLLAPLGKALFHFNMQFDYDPEIQGDLEVKARGTESLMASEVRSQRLMQFLSIVQNPMLAPFAKMDYIIREIAKSMDLDPDKVTNSLADAAIQAEIMKKFQQTMMPQEQGGQPGAPAVPAPNDTQGSGNGNIGIGQAPTPGEQGFSGVPQ